MKKIQLLLTNPCSENWDDMQSTATGRYCDNCEKHIIDLTTKSDAELIQFFKKKNDNVCGRLFASQFNRELVQPTPKINWQWLMPLAIGAMLISPAQANKLRPLVIHHEQGSASPKPSVSRPISPPVALANISGQITDQLNGAPLKGVKIRQKGFENVLALTDSAGKFELATTVENLESEFTFELDGYSMMQARLTEGVAMKLTMYRRIILGGISAVRLDREPFYLIYVGKKSCSIDASKLKEIPADWIQNLEVLNGAKASALYGSKAANGAILIEIKKAYAKKIDFSKEKF